MIPEIILMIVPLLARVPKLKLLKSVDQSQRQPFSEPQRDGINHNS